MTLTIWPGHHLSINPEDFEHVRQYYVKFGAWSDRVSKQFTTKLKAYRKPAAHDTQASAMPIMVETKGCAEAA